VPKQGWTPAASSFGEVHFAVGSGVNKVTIPVNAMLFRAEGPRVAVIGPAAKCSCVLSTSDAITAPRWNSGRRLAHNQIVINPADSLEEGQQVNVVQPPAQQQPGAPSQVRRRAARREASCNRRGSALLALLRDARSARVTAGPRLPRRRQMRGRRNHRGSRLARKTHPQRSVVAGFSRSRT